MLLEAPLFKKKQANSCLSLSLLIGLAETNINFAKFRLRRKIFEKTSQAGTTFASNVIRSTTVEERKAITHLSLMIEKKEQEAITHVSLSLSLWTHKPPHAKAPSLRGSAPSGCTDASSHYLLSEFPSALLSEFPSHTSPVRTA